MRVHRNLEGLRGLLVADRRGRLPGVVAVDVSRRAVGLAGADPTWTLVTPIGSIRRTRLAADLEALARVLEEREAKLLVLGWPLSMDGTEGPRCQSVMAFARSLAAACDLPVVLQDERLTTFAAQEAFGPGRRSRAAPDLDALAAARILEDFLERVRN